MSSSRGRSRSRTGQGKAKPVTVNPPEVVPTLQLLVGNVAVAIEDVSAVSPIQTIIRKLRAHVDNRDLQKQLSSATNSAYKFYALDPPLYVRELQYSDAFHLVTNSVDLFELHMKKSVPPQLCLEDLLASGTITLDQRQILFYIEPPVSNMVLLEQELLSTFPELFASLTVEITDRWSEHDIRKNNASILPGDDNAPTSIKAMIRRLARPRQYIVGANSEAYQSCQRALKDTFGKYFVQATASRILPPIMESPLEFAYFAFVDVLVEELEQSDVLDSVRLSELKAAMMTSSYIIPPGMAHNREKTAKYAIGKSWPFKIFVKQGDQPTARYQPKSDFSFSSFDGAHNMPFVLGEIVSEIDGSDRWRMLCQAIALVRFGTSIWKGSDGPFVVMAVYVTDAFTAERYLVYQPDSSNREVHMLRHTFALNTREGGRDFLLNMYNYGAEMARFTQGFSATSFEGLKSMMAMGGKLRSWTDQSKHSRSGSNNRSRKMHTVQEEDQEEPTDDSCLALLPEEVMADLGLKTDVFVLPDNPFVAKVWRLDGATHVCYLKLLRPSRSKEADVLEHLATVDAPNKHVVRPLAVRHVVDGTLLLLPDVGVAVSNYSHLPHALLSIVRQFFQGVAFLHKHKVAHCDLKPSNVLVDESTGLVTIIDFDLAIQGPKLVEGFAGTDGWTAPEVGGAGRYNPIKADLWAAGKVVRTLCETCPLTVSCKLLLDLCHSLMDPVPAKRPAMQKVLDTLDRYARFAQVLPPAAEPGSDFSFDHAVLVN